MFRSTLTRFIALSVLASGLALSSAAPVNADHESDVILFEGGGFGHGVGMSQFGAFGRAEAGHTTEEILAFYYDGTTVENRGQMLTDFLGDGIRVRLSPAFKSLDRPDGVTVTGRDDALLTVRFNDDNVHTANSIYLEQAGQKHGSSNNVTEPDDEWYWIVKLDGSDDDVCDGCIASSATIEWPEGAIVDIVDDVGSQGAHDAGDLTLVGRDTASGDTPDSVFVVLQLPLEDYLHGIDEVPQSWPDAALQAQAIAARSYASAQAISRRNAGWSFDVYDSVQDQVYDGYEDEFGNFIEHESRLAAVIATEGQVVVYDDAIVRTFYSSSNGGYTAASEDSFLTPEPFHIAKPDPYDSAPAADGDAQNPFPFRQFSYTRDALSRWLQYDNMDVGILQSITFNDPVPSGRVNDITVTLVGSDRERTVSGNNLRFAIANGCREDEANPALDYECEDYPRSSHLRLSPPVFDDVPFDAYFYRPVLWMSAEGITTGVSDTLFAPEREVSRAEVATFVWRFWDSPEPQQPSPFDDIDPDSYYTAAVAWMKEAGITTGTSATTFSPDELVTRGQLATFLWRLAGKPAAPVSEQFEDVPAGAFYTEAVHWMLHWAITTGTSPTTFSPDDPLTRGQIATFLWRLARTPAAFADGTDLPSTMLV